MKNLYSSPPRLQHGIRDSPAYKPAQANGDVFTSMSRNPQRDRVLEKGYNSLLYSSKHIIPRI